jgi:hypothetical protein
MRVKINKYNIEGVKYYRGYWKIFWCWVPVTGYKIDKEDVKYLLDIY